MELPFMSATEYQVIAIDGPAASGKSSVSKRLAERLGFVYVNSGEMYQAVTWAVISRGLDTGDGRAVRDYVEGLEIRCGVAPGTRRSTIAVDGVDPEPYLRGEAVNANVSAVSAIPEVRGLLVELQQRFGGAADIVMEGRDIGSVVFPETPFKFFLQASETERQRRREAEGHTDPIAERDKQDSSRKASPMVIAADAEVIDTTELSLHDVVDLIEARYRKKKDELGL